MDKNKLLDQLNKLLIKKAEGFYYTEEAYEYTLENKKEAARQLSFFDEKDIEMPQKNILKTLTKSVSKTAGNKKQGVKSGCEEMLDEDLIKESIVPNENQQSLTLSKKKVTTHFVPPDMLAIKMLFEINSNEGDSCFDTLTDDELKELIKSLT